MRLIDADILKERIAIRTDPNLLTKGRILAAIDTQPTSYDVDKVVEELEVKKNKLVSEGSSLAAHQLVMAIKIVKEGGVDDRTRGNGIFENFSK